MAITVDATVGGANANSFVTVAEADTYLETRLNASAWTGEDDKKRAVIEATRELSARSWRGKRTDGTQALAWPRQWAHDPDSPIQDYYPTTLIPARVKRATFELALEFLKAGATDVAALPAEDGVIRKKVDVLETEYARPWDRPGGLHRFPSVMREIGPLFATSGPVMHTLRG